MADDEEEEEEVAADDMKEVGIETLEENEAAGKRMRKRKRRLAGCWTTASGIDVEEEDDGREKTRTRRDVDGEKERK